MGIRGFTSFVDSRGELLHDFRLHDTRVVIDGNNLYHFLYHYLHVKHQYGGDYDIYYKKVRDIFQMFLSCNIKPFVVFDGGYEADGKKLKTILTRAKNRIHLAGHISHGGRGQILPILAEEVFQAVLIDLQIPFVVCDFEADAELVKLANQWKCPVMSNDSDFFVFDLVGGFILFDYIDFRLSTSGLDKESDKYFLAVQLYHVDNFATVFPRFNKQLFPIIAILLGNDFIEAAMFDNFFSNLRLVGSKSLPQRHRRIMSVLHWLEECSSCENAIDKILCHIQNSKEETKNQIKKCVDFYTKFEESFVLSDYFAGDMNASHENSENVKLYNGSLPPTWFISAHRSGKLHAFLLNTAVCHRVVLLAQVENMREISAYTTSVDIRQAMYGILLREDLHSQTEDDRVNQASHVLEYTRDEFKNLKKTFLKPLLSLPDYGSLPGLSEIVEISLGKREDLLLEVMCLPRCFIEEFSQPLQLVMCVIVYWVCHSQPKILKQHYQALLVCIILLQAKSRIKQIKIQENCDVAITSLNQTEREESKGDQICIQTCIEDASEKELTTVLQKLDKFHGKFMTINNTNPVESSITHGTSQFQACLYDAMHLNMLLREPLQSPQPHKFISGVFLYNFIKELKSRLKPELYICDILGAKSPLSELFKKMDGVLGRYIPEGSFQEPVTGKKNSKRKDKKKKAKSGGASSGARHDSDSSDDLPEMVQAACQLDNRFSCLGLEDC